MARSTWAVIQARTGSTRLPAKVLADIGGRTMLDRVIDGVAASGLLDGIVVATTAEVRDDPIAAAMAGRDVVVVRGAQDDVLDRYHDALHATRARAVVRITSDCPLIDPELIDEVVVALGHDADYASNTLDPRTYPRGLDVEAMTAAALERAWAEDDNPIWREHVTPYIYRNPEKFALHRVQNDRDLSHHRWTVDTAEDLALVRRIYQEIGERPFTWHDVLEVVEQHPDLTDLNQDVRQKQVP